MRNILIAAAALFSAVTANAATVVFNFDDLDNQVAVPGNYGGAVWTGFQTASGFGQTSQPRLAYVVGTSGAVDYAAGFSALSFRVGLFTPATFNVYSGVGGTGSLLGTLLVPSADPQNFAAASVSFTGIGKSITISGANGGSIGWDDVTLTSGSVPESATWMLLITGFGMVGVSARRRKAAIAA